MALQEQYRSRELDRFCKQVVVCAGAGLEQKGNRHDHTEKAGC